MNAADADTLKSLRSAMSLRQADAERELAFAAEMGPGKAADRAMQRREGALADVAEIAAQLAKVD